MQETDQGARPILQHSWWKRLLIGALVGGFFGALEIWFYEFSLNRLMAAILSGASFFAIIGLVAVKYANGGPQVIALGGFAGFLAGIAYWVVARPSSSPLLAVGIGLVAGIGYAWAGWAESKA